MNDRGSVFWTRKTAFIIDPPKLTRIVEIIGARYERVKSGPRIDFKVELKDSRLMVFSDYAKVLSLDNAVRNPIKTLEISASTESEAGLSCRIRLDGKAAEPNVELDVRATDSKVANEAFGDLEEQVERLCVRSWVANWRTSRPFAFIFAISIVAIGLTGFALALKKSTTINPPEMEQLAAEANSSTTTDEKINFLFQLGRLYVSKELRDTLDFSRLLTFKSLALMIPLILCLGCFTYIGVVCYPASVFDWGDYGEHYKTLKSRRNGLWWAIFVGLFINVLAGFFVAAIH